MTHPITPPPELMQQLYGLPQMRAIEKAYQAGADQELEACADWLANARNHTLSWNEATNYSANLRTARRPKPPSLKEQALEALDRMDQLPTFQDMHTIRRALEALPNDQH
jgi:hypothetical protein